MKELVPISSDTKEMGTSGLKTILLAGLCVGTLDILAALADYYISTGKNPGVVLKFIASGVFGRKAFSGGINMILLGLFFHFIIAFSFTVLFFWLYPKIKLLSKNRIATGIVYGIFIWLVMNLIVVPMSQTPPHSHKIEKIIKAILILIVMIGLPLSFIAHRAFARNPLNKNDTKNDNQDL